MYSAQLWNSFCIDSKSPRLDHCARKNFFLLFCIVIYDNSFHMHASRADSPSSYIAWASVHHLYIHVQTTSKAGWLNKYEYTMDRELWTELLAGSRQTPGWCCMCTPEMALLFCTGWRHGAQWHSFNHTFTLYKYSSTTTTTTTWKYVIISETWLRQSMHVRRTFLMYFMSDLKWQSPQHFWSGSSQQEQQQQDDDE